MANNDVSEEKLDSHFILRLPKKEASVISKYLRKKPKKIKKHLKINLDPETRQGEVILKKKSIPMKLVDMPTIIESMKSTNQKTFFKTANVCQMLIPEDLKDLSKPGKEDKNHLWPHGLTPPLKNVRKLRFRRTLKNKQSMDANEIEKEVKWLLRMDNDAVMIRWELTDDHDKKKKKPEPRYTKEKLVFGEIISDSNDDDDDIINIRYSSNNSQDTRSEISVLTNSD